MRARQLGCSLATTTACLVIVAGCGPDDSDPPEPSGSPSSSPTDPTDSTSTSASTETTSPSPDVEPASGVLLQGDGVSVHAPEGWELDDPIVDFLETANAPESTNSLGLASSDAIGEPTLRQQAESAITVGGWVQDPEILPPVTVAGVRMYHVAGQIDAATNLELIGTVHEGHQVEISLFFERGTTPAAEQDQITESVWASVAWD